MNDIELRIWDASLEGDVPRKQMIIPAISAVLHEKRGGVFCDYGCGSGFVARKVIERSGFVGRYLGIDTSEFARKFTHESLRNFRCDKVIIAPEDILKYVGFVDVLLCGFLLVEVADPLPIFGNIASLLNSTGRAFVFVPDSLRETDSLSDPNLIGEIPMKIDSRSGVSYRMFVHTEEKLLNSATASGLHVTNSSRFEYIGASGVLAGVLCLEFRKT